MLSFFFGGILGSLHGVRICEAEGLRVDEFGSLLADIAPLLGGDVKHLAESIHAGKYENPEALLKTWAAALERIEQHAREAKINFRVSGFCLSALPERYCCRLRNGGGYFPHQSSACGPLTPRWSGRRLL